MSDIQSVLDNLDNAVASGQLLESSRDNIRALLEGSTSPIAAAAITELAGDSSWEELNDRFFKTLAFGTGGLRGRTVGRIVTNAEQGEGGPNDRPEHPCVGTASMNFSIYPCRHGAPSRSTGDFESIGRATTRRS